MKFSEFNLDQDLLKGINEAGFAECFPVQELTLRQTLQGKDVCVQSQTGSGKTAAFLVTIFHLFRHDTTLKQKKALVIVPTRELVVQIVKEAELLGTYLNIKVGGFFGGVGYREQEDMLKKGVDIVVSTPGRLIDFSNSGKCRLKEFDILVIDEADRLFDMGFLPDLRKILRQLPPYNERRSMLFSATLHTRVKNTAYRYMNNPEDISIDPQQTTVDTVTQELYHVSKTEKMSLLLGLLRREKPRSAIVFTNTKRAAYEISRRLQHNGYQCSYLSGALSQNRRLKIIENIKSGKLLFMVATDVAARGLHIEDLDLVINYDLPEHSENYIHRIGRTARAGKTGKAIALACESDVYNLAAIEAATKSKIPVVWATDELFMQDESSGKYYDYEQSTHRSDYGKHKRNKQVTDGRARKGNRPGQKTGGQQSRPERPKTASNEQSKRQKAADDTGKSQKPRNRSAGKQSKQQRVVRKTEPSIQVVTKTPQQTSSLKSFIGTIASLFRKDKQGS